MTRTPTTSPTPTDQPDRRAVLRRLGQAAIGVAAASVLGGCSTSRGRVGQPIPADPTLTPLGDIPEPPTAGLYDPAQGAVSRASWARFGPNRALADTMLPIEYITVHHDGMDAFTATGERAAAARLETIRRSHVGRGWADIGYHYAVDPAGRVWQGRPLSLQGAHVGGRNEGNLGIVVLGNYELQRVSSATMRSLASLIRSESTRYRVPMNRVLTHREWAPTACPGRSLQAEMDRLRGGSFRTTA